MKKSFGILGLALSLTASCGGDDEPGGATASGGLGGSAGTGGIAGTGGAPTTGGAGGSSGSAGVGGQPCAGGLCEPVELASDLAYPFRIAVDTSRVYVALGGTWDDPSGTPNWDGGFVSLAPDGTNLQKDPTTAAFLAVAVDADRIVTSYQDNGSGMLSAQPKGGGTATTLDTQSTSFLTLDTQDPATVATEVYYALGPQVVAVGLSGGVQRVIASVAANSVQGIAVDNTHVFYADPGEFDANGVGLGGGKLFRAPRSGGTPEEIVSQAGLPHWVAVDSTHVYFTDHLDGTVVKVAKDGSSAPEMLASGQLAPYALVVDDTRVVWSNRGKPYWEPGDCTGAGAIMTVPKSGGTPTTLAPSRTCPGALAQDSAFIYWVDQGSEPRSPVRDGALFKIAK